MPGRRQVTYSQRPTHAARQAHRAGERQFRTYDTSAIRPKRSKVPDVIAAVVIIVVLVLITFGISTLLRGCGGSQLAEGETAQVTVTEGEGANSIAKSLQSAGLISNTKDFTDRVSALNANDSLQPGTYTIAGGTSVDDIIKMLETPVTAASFTIPEGSTLAQTAQIVADATNGAVSADDFTAAASDASKYAQSYSFLADAGTRSLEGFLFPKTYPIGDNPSADSLIRQMLDQYQTETASLDYSYAQSRNLSAYDVLKLASIVEKESDADHRATVASVFYNRLAQNMRLQSDATVAYFVGHDPTPEDVATANEYNTYTVDGLPPTPINSPSLETLQAVCSPQNTNYLYFYFSKDSSGTMQYQFSETYEEHQSTYE